LGGLTKLCLSYLTCVWGFLKSTNYVCVFWIPYELLRWCLKCYYDDRVSWYLLRLCHRRLWIGPCAGWLVKKSRSLISRRLFVLFVYYGRYMSIPYFYINRCGVYKGVEFDWSMAYFSVNQKHCASSWFPSRGEGRYVK